MEQQYNGPRWDKVAAMAIIMIVVLFVVYFGSRIAEDALGDLGKYIWWIIVFLAVSWAGLTAAQFSGVSFYKSGVDHGAAATIAGLDAAVDATTSNDQLDVQKLKVFGQAIKPQTQQALDEQKIIAMLDANRVKLAMRGAENQLKLEYNEANDDRKDRRKAAANAERDQAQALLLAKQQQEQDELNARYAGFEEEFDDDDDESEVGAEWQKVGHWNGGGQ